MDTLKLELKKGFAKIKNNHYIQVFTTFLMLSLLFFIIPTLSNNLTLPLNGDYALQSYAFYVDGYTRMWNFFKTGQYPLFDYSNGLGANYFGAFTFYYASSPFFLILLLCPFAYIYQGIFLLLVIKYAIGATFFYVLLKKFFHVKDRTAFVGAIAYAFSGWTLYYLWFHFADVVAVYPLVFMGIELLLQKKKRWLLILSIFLLGITNYFFLVPFVILGVFYSLFRFFQIYGLPKNIENYKKGERWSILLQGILCFICGMLLASFVLFPSYLIVLESERAESTSLMIDFLSFFFVNPQRIDGSLELGKWRSISEIFSFKYQVTNGAGEVIKTVTLYDFIFKWDVKYGSRVESIPGYVLSEFFVMNFKCIGNAVYGIDLDNAMGGMFITTPLALLMVPSAINSLRRKKWGELIGLTFCVALPFIPFTYYLLQGFTGIYGRWQLFLVVVAIIYAVKTLDRIEEVQNLTFIVALVVNVFLTVLALDMSLENGSLPLVYNDGTRLVPDERLLLYAGQILYMALATILFICYRQKKWFPKLISTLVCAEVMLSCYITVEAHGYADESTLFGGQAKLKEQRTIIDYLEEKDKDFYRIQNSMATRAYSNHPATLSYNGLSTFNSIYNKNLDPFLNRARMKYGGSWSMGYHEKRVYFEQFLGVKYHLVNAEDYNNDGLIDATDPYNGRISFAQEQQDYSINMPFIYSLDEQFETFDVYKNDQFIHLGFAYDDYILASTVGQYNESIYYDTLYTSMVIIDDEDIDEIRANYTDGTFFPSYSNGITTKFNDIEKSISMREDCADLVCHSASNTEQLDRKRNVHTVANQDALNNLLLNTYKTNFVRSRWYSLNFYGDQLIMQNRNGKTVCSNATIDNPCYVEVNFKMGPNVLISLFNGDKLVTQDAHMNHNYYIHPYNYEYKAWRGFYVSEPITHSVIEFLGDTEVTKFRINDFSYSYSYYNDFINAFNKFKADPLYDIEIGIDSYQFKTNYPKNKLLVLNVPYDTGWSLKLNGKDTKIYPMQGGFIGIIAPSGEATYELNYFTPGLKVGFLVSFSALLMAAFIGLVYNRQRIIVILKAGKNLDDLKANIAKAETIEEIEEARKNYPDIKKIEVTMEILRFILVGGIATAIDLALYGLFKHLLGSVYLSAGIGFIGGLIVSYLLSLVFVFKNARKVAKEAQGRTMSTFFITSLIGLVITEIGMLLLHGLCGLYDPFVRLFMIGVVLIWNYLSKKLYVFKEKK